MTVTVNGTTGVSLVQDLSVNPSTDIAYTQTWQDVTGTTTSGVPRTNTTGQPIEVSVYSTSAINTAGSVQIAVGALIVAYNYAPPVAGASTVTHVSCLVPNGTAYTITWAGTGSVKELR